MAENPVHLHIIGICGTFMGGVARLALAAGHRVTGCDAAAYPPMSDQLRAAGVQLIEGYGADQIALRPDLFIVGNVVSRGNPLFEAVLDSRARFTSGPAWVGENLLHGRHVIAIAGTHGKTTTSAMVAWILQHAGVDPGFLIGGVPVDFNISARLGSGESFVIEADEYDSALFDKRSKFVHYFPSTLILNNLEFDHADIFPDLAAIETQFHHLLRCVPRTGRVIANGRDAALARVLARGVWSEVQHFDTDDDWHWRDSLDGSDAFAIWRGESCLGTLVQAPSGNHNRSNALAAIAAATHVGIGVQQSLAALRCFAGVQRRLEIRGCVHGVTVYDDFAHHPTAIAATLAGLRRRVGSARILGLLEPRSNTMRLGAMQDMIAGSLRDADLVFCYGPRSGPHALGWDPRDALQALGTRARVFDQLDELVAALMSSVRPGDHVVAMSNGSFGGVHGRILAALAALPADFGRQG
ncbi:UDP-N-acetylmuramate:L-alanyl-gamma-D-glutamyl-meso-diaminopimelate ligase [Burkholderiales bacterium]|jgi:UDP-N-acetylmuramate: L-alanyl-gamma-D-glutamyl-meso-diaminopimelate ligase|nr:UDP-N-acetylmuramate:L-alanyl-gamma-D-glutamyl-meso-diaminopimelate ligase [Burkholderiales bacterium]